MKDRMNTQQVVVELLLIGVTEVKSPVTELGGGPGEEAGGGVLRYPRAMFYIARAEKNRRF